MPPKRGGKNTTRKVKVVAQDLPIPDASPLFDIMNFTKLVRGTEKVLAKEFYCELEIAMNELAEQKNHYKAIVMSYLGENKVPHTPRKNPPGILALKQINDHKYILNFDSDEDISADGESSILRERILELNQNAATPNRSHDLFSNSPQVLIKTPLRTTPKLCELPKQAEIGLSPQLRATPRHVRARNTPELPPHFVLIEPIDPTLIPSHANGYGRKNEADATSTSISTLTGDAGPSHIRNLIKPMKAKTEVDKSAKVKQIDEKLNRAVMNHKYILNEKAERTRREREGNARRVEMNIKMKQQQEQDQIQQAKAREQKLREFQAKQMQQVSTPKTYGLRSNAPANSALKTPSQNTRIPITPGRQAIPAKKTKHEMASPFTFPSQSSQSNIKRKKPQPHLQEKAANIKKVNNAAKNQMEVQKILEIERLHCEKQECIQREQQEQELIQCEQEILVLEEERIRVLLEEREESKTRLIEEEQDCKIQQDCKMQNEEQLNDVKADDESMIIDSEERIEAPEDNDADNSTNILTDQVQELSMVDSNNVDDGKENEIPLPNTNALLPNILLNKTLEKIATENYNVDDLSSNDSTDDEDHPRKQIPQWARSKDLVPHVRVIEKIINASERAKHFGTIQAPNIYQLFPTKKKYPSRTSSAIWTSPLTNPTPGYSRYQQFVSSSLK